MKNKKQKMIVEEGIYIGAGCSLIIDKGIKGKTLSEITIVVSEEQIQWLKKWRNYEFHFDLEGEFTGTGTITTAIGQNKGEIIDTKKDELDKIERNTFKMSQM